MDAIRVTKVKRVQLDLFVPPPPSTSGAASVTKQRLSITLHLTPHHLVLSPDEASSADDRTSAQAKSKSKSRSSLDPTKMTDEIWIPYPSITLLTRLPQTIRGLYPLQIRTRNFGSYVLGFERDREGGAEDVWQSVKDCAVSASVEQLYAFNYALPAVASSSKQTLAPLPQQHQAHTDDHSPLSSSPPRDAAPSLPPKSGPSSAPGWQVYNPRSEFARQGVGSRTRAWRFTDINKEYAFSPTYPAKMVVPSRIGDAVLQYAGKYRSKARIPALTYLHWANNASITRSSQPMVGLKGARSAQDEKLVECIFSSHNSPEDAYSSPSSSSVSAAPQPHVYGATTTNLIIDARPTTNAMANVAMGAGTENMEHYKFGKKAYLGIDNIHVMRKSLNTIIEALTEAEVSGNIIDRGLLRKSNWLRHISTILDGALMIIRNIHLNASHVLIHCSDGWDRTAQLSALAQVCLDPYYRTIDGFRILIEKDWVSFGHKFLDRSGHLSSEKHFTVVEPEDDSDDELGGGGPGGGAQKAAQAFFASVQKQFASSGNSHQKEISPVFHQFLDCVRQVQRQFPERFEYNEQFLLDLHYHLYSCQFGTFLFNSERERRVPPSLTYKAYCERTVSIWDWVDLDRSPYLNHTFDAALDDRQSRDERADQGVLMLDPKDVKFWHGLFRRGDEEMNGSKLALAQAQGAEVLTVSAGQVDPGTPDAMVDNSLGALRPPAADSSTSGPPSRSRTPVSSPPAKSARVPTSPSSGGSGSGWNWSQFSSGAFNALSVAGSQIKTISTEAMNQIRAEANEGRELGGLARNNYPSTASTSGAVGQPRAVRLPSEANPWSTPDEPANMSSSPAPPRPPAKDEPRTNRAWNHDPWGDTSTIDRQSAVDDRPSLDRLTLHEDPPRSRGPSPRPAPASGPANGPAAAPAPPPKQSDADKALEEAALGGDRKAWDPLGAL